MAEELSTKTFDLSTATTRLEFEPMAAGLAILAATPGAEIQVTQSISGDTHTMRNGDGLVGGVGMLYLSWAAQPYASIELVWWGNYRPEAADVPEIVSPIQLPDPHDLPLHVAQAAIASGRVEIITAEASPTTIITATQDIVFTLFNAYYGAGGSYDSGIQLYDAGDVLIWEVEPPIGSNNDSMGLVGCVLPTGWTLKGWRDSVSSVQVMYTAKAVLL